MAWVVLGALGLGVAVCLVAQAREAAHAGPWWLSGFLLVSAGLTLAVGYVAAEVLW